MADQINKVANNIVQQPDTESVDKCIGLNELMQEETPQKNNKRTRTERRTQAKRLKQSEQLLDAKTRELSAVLICYFTPSRICLIDGIQIPHQCIAPPSNTRKREQRASQISVSPKLKLVRIINQICNKLQ